MGTPVAEASRTSGAGSASGAWYVQARNVCTAPIDQRGGAEDVDLDEQCGEVGEVLRVADGGLRHHHRHEDAARAAHPLGHVAACAAPRPGRW